MDGVASVQPPLLQIENYSFCFPSYPGLQSSTLFNNLNFQLSKGEFKIIMGPPESGKTTLSRCLCSVYPGLIQAETEGRILIEGDSLTTRAACDWIDKIGLVFQNPDEQIVTTRVDDEAAFSLESLGMDPDEIERRMKQAFAEFSVPYPEDRNPLSLSGGEKKRLLLAVLRMQNPDLWILDEPLDELDREGQRFLLQSLATLAEKEDKGILMFSSKYHRVFDSIKADLSVLAEGRIIEREDTDDFPGLLRAQGLLPPKEVPEKDAPCTSGLSPLIKMTHLRFRYAANPDFSLNIEDFTLYQGETLVLAGPNGCGKSTLARLLCGLIESQSGTLMLDGEDAAPGVLNRSCAYLFQNPDYQLFLPTASEELELGLKNAGLSRKQRHMMVEEGLELFKIPGRDTPPSLMSFGARKRLQGGIYYLLKKRLYILDEADSGLNYRDYELIVRQLKAKGSTLLVITHNSEIPAIEGDRICFMSHGRIISEQPLKKEAVQW